MAFCQKVMPVTSKVGAKSGVFTSTASLDKLIAPIKPIAKSSGKIEKKDLNLTMENKPPKKSRSTADLKSIQFSEAPVSYAAASIDPEDGGWNEFGSVGSYQSGGSQTGSNDGMYMHTYEFILMYIDMYTYICIYIYICICVYM
jgi:hypothetical protein